MKNIERQIYIDGVYSVLYGFDWETMEAIYRQAINGVAKYVRVSVA